MRRPVGTVGVALLVEDLAVVRKSFATRLVVVHESDGAGPLALREPDGRAIPYAQVPVCVHRQDRVYGKADNAAVFPSGGQFRGEDGALDARFEAALVLLRILIGRHVLLSCGQFRLVDDACLRGFVAGVEPARLTLGLLDHVVKLVFPSRRTKEPRPSLSITEGRANNFSKNAWRLQAVLIKYHAVEVEAA